MSPVIMAPHRLLFFLFIATLVLLLSCCTHRGIVLNADETVVKAAFHATSSRASEQKGNPHPSANHDVLVLTSGGADGAFGAGVLNAWTQSGNRPVFDVVAGASTGALQATSAFLGEGHDPYLEQVYTTTRTSDVIRFNGLRAIAGSGLYDPAPLRRHLMERTTQSLLDDVAAAHHSGRRLYIATTDLTHGKTVYWNMGEIAAGGGNRQSNYVDILIASAAPPGLIEPVRIADVRRKTSSLHGDGGVKSPVPFESFMLPGSGSARARVWVIANGHVSRDAASASDAQSALTLARRGVTQLLRQLLYSSVREAEMKAMKVGSWFRLIALPDEIAEAVNPFEFDPAEMKSLYQTGRTVGAETFKATGN